ncbi:CaiB/BaiF CoA transferase family protein [Schauerella aestuarii]|uniref:CaiB/BaiF CoA transferase family protein n=1 Tax=Schauerella aestuarii TaxID=2511204 RepID=UPI001371A18E|nr:CaiB/BaiF CoA-transferase family protein [Achromobacter aestuarii]MYZ42245.1 CoA transferase [Achromobacter aestuarii]
MRPLAGLKVVDFSKVLAGPLCAQYLGELGAEVIKVEPIELGDDTRGWTPTVQGESTIFLAVNHNKRSIALDLKATEGREVAHRLVEDADIVLQGFGSGSAQRLGIDRTTLMALNPKLIYCEISGYGRTGPMGNEPGYDVMLQAFSGMISTLGHPEGDFARASFSPVDIGTAMFGLSGVLAAVIERQRTGKGVYVELALLDTALGFMSYMAQTYWHTGKDPQRMGTAHPSMCPYQAFQAKDGPLMLGAGNDAQWRRFCEAADMAEYADHPDFATNAQRLTNLARTVQLVQQRIATRTVSEWVSLLSHIKVSCSPIHTLGQALNHPQVQARELIACTEHPVAGTLKHIGLSVKFEDHPRETVCPPPLHGQHTRDVLQELGYDADAIATLLKASVVHQWKQDATNQPEGK